MGCNCNVLNAIGYIVISALCKKTILVFVGALAVSKVVAVLPVCSKGSFSATLYICDIPSGHDHIGIVASILLTPGIAVRVAKDLIIVRQLDLSITEIVVDGIHCRDGYVHRSRAFVVGTSIDIDLQGAKGLSFGLGFSFRMEVVSGQRRTIDPLLACSIDTLGGTGIDDRRVEASRLKDRIRSSSMIDSGPRQDHTPIMLELDI
jgi:hypothetical protein